MREHTPKDAYGRRPFVIAGVFLDNLSSIMSTIYVATGQGPHALVPLWWIYIMQIVVGQSIVLHDSGRAIRVKDDRQHAPYP